VCQVTPPQASQAGRQEAVDDTELSLMELGEGCEIRRDTGVEHLPLQLVFVKRHRLDDARGGVNHHAHDIVLWVFGHDGFLAGGYLDGYEAHGVGIVAANNIERVAIGGKLMALPLSSGPQWRRVCQGLSVAVRTKRSWPPSGVAARAART